MIEETRIGLISLGCPKNEVDAEVMLNRIKNAGFIIEPDPAECEVIIINTCGFIESAKKESIDTILEVADLKETGALKKLIVSGCFSSRYPNDIYDDMPEVDVVLGISQYPDIVSHIKKTLNDKRYICSDLDESFASASGRMIITPPWRAYLKIAEGCSNKCAYCAIPQIRGKLRSRDHEDIIDETKFLIDTGVKEITLVAQDTTRYGTDKNQTLSRLLQDLSDLDSKIWFRVLYMYPEMIDNELIEIFAERKNICSYMDIPLQHSHPDILRKMNRHSTRDGIIKMYKKLRDKIPDISLRTTYITGFPGENQSHFDDLVKFIHDYPFDNAGVFSYSKEEGTPAYDFSNQVNENVAQERMDLLLYYQSDISKGLNQKRIGKIYDVIIEDMADDNIYSGRSQHFAPEIDGEITVISNACLDDGSFHKVKIDDAGEYDLSGHIKNDKGGL